MDDVRAYASDIRSSEPSMAKLQDRNTVGEALDGYAKLLAQLEAQIDDHAQRINGVLAPVEPSPGSNGALAAGRPCSDIVNRIQGLNDSLHALMNRMANITARVEL